MIKLTRNQNESGTSFDSLLEVDVLIPEDIVEKVLNLFFKIYMLRNGVILVRDVVRICFNKLPEDDKNISLVFVVNIQNDLLEKTLNRYFKLAHPGKIMLPLDDKLYILDDDMRGQAFWLLVRLYLKKEMKGTER